MNGSKLPPDARLAQGFAMQPPAGVMGWLPPKFWNTIKEFYGYNVDFLPIPSLGTQTQTFTVQADSDFIFLFLTGQGTMTDNVTPLPFKPVLIDLKDNSVGSSLTQKPTHYENWIGDGRNPGVMAIPYYLKANSSLAVTIQNLEANDRNYRFTFFGFRSIPNSNMSNGALR